MSEHRDIARSQLRIDEGIRYKPYRDSVNKLSIGVGRNLDDKGLRPDEVALMLENDIEEAEVDCIALYPNFSQLSAVRRAVLINMAFNLGRKRFSGFKLMRAAVLSGRFNEAARQMMGSRWARQVGERAIRLSKQMRDG